MNAPLYTLQSYACSKCPRIDYLIKIDNVHSVLPHTHFSRFVTLLFVTIDRGMRYRDSKVHKQTVRINEVCQSVKQTVSA
jgi:hypothetical protein